MIAFSLSTFLVTVINVGILFFVLRAVLFKPVTKFMADRSAKIEDAIAQAENDRNEAKDMLVQYGEKLKQAEIESADLIRKAKAIAGEEADRIIANSKTQAENILFSARDQITAEQKAAMTEFRKEAARLVTAASGKILGRELKSEDNKAYAGLLLDEIGKN
jgi:F-type H+-transporting ATPase subunit b